jgi:hypothetical protein
VVAAAAAAYSLLLLEQAEAGRYKLKQQSFKAHLIQLRLDLAVRQQLPKPTEKETLVLTP